MKRSSGEKGMALVMVLILAAISLSIMAALVYMLVSSTQISGIEKRYKTAADAAKGGAEVIYQVIGTQGRATDLSTLMTAVTTGTGSLWSTIATDPANCSGTTSDGRPLTGFQAKLMTPTTSWSPQCNAGMTVSPANYDMAVEFGLGLGSNYRVYMKLADTVEGKSIDTGLLQSGTASTDEGIKSQPRPYLYTIEVDAENKDNPQERAKYSILYAY